MRFRLFIGLILILALLFLMLPLLAFAQGNAIADKIRACSVTIFAGHGRGSGTLTTTKDGTVWCLTAAHVVADGPGHLATAKVAQFKSDAEGKATETSVLGEVVRCDAKADLALLRVGKSIFGSPRVTFATKTAALDSPVWHCGTLLGTYHHSLSKGEVVAVGRWIDSKVMDQGDFTGFPGSSGGGVFTPAGEYVGMVVWGAPCRVSCYIPIRSIRAWAKSAGVEFVIDPSLSVPDALPADAPAMHEVDNDD